MIAKRFSVLLVMVLALHPLSKLVAQEMPQPNSGVKSYGSYSSGTFDHIDLATGNIYGEIPLISYPQLGGLTPLTFSVKFNTAEFSPEMDCDIWTEVCYTSYGPDFDITVGSNYQFGGVDVRYLDSFPFAFCWRSDGQCDRVQQLAKLYTVTDRNGTLHNMVWNKNDLKWLYATDGSGYSYHSAVDPFDRQTSCGHVGEQSCGTVYDPDGIGYNDIIADFGSRGSIAADSLGNSIKRYSDTTYPDNVTVPIANARYIDSIGRVIPDITTDIDYMNYYDADHDNAGIYSRDTSQCPNLGISNQPATVSVKWTPPGVAKELLFCFTDFQFHPMFLNIWESNDEIAAIFNSAEPVSQNTVSIPDGVPAAEFGRQESNRVYGAEALQSVTLPDGTSWGFIYDASALYVENGKTYSTEAYGNIRKIILPTGGSISYEYTNITRNPEIDYWYFDIGGSFYPPMYRAIKSRTMDDGKGGVSVTNYSYSAGQNKNQFVTTEAFADGSIIHTFTDLSGYNQLFETDAAYKDTAGAILKEVTTSYQFHNGITLGSSEDASYRVTNVLPSLKTVIMDGKIQTNTSYQYPPLIDPVLPYCDLFYQLNCYLSDSAGGSHGVGPISFVKPQRLNVTDESGKVLETTTSEFEFQDNSSYKSVNLLNLISNLTIQDGSGNVVSKTTYGYDENNGSPSGPLGNRTSVNRWLNTTNSYVTSSIIYTAHGMPWKQIDPKNNRTTITYDGTGLFPSSIVYPSTDGVTHVEQFVYDSNTGVLTSHTGETSVQQQFSYDSAGRISTIKNAVGTTRENWIQYSYPSATRIDVSQDKDSKGDAAVKSTFIFDGLGRKVEQILSNGAEIDTAYDSDGRVSSVSSPYFPNSNSSHATTSYAYDAIGRMRYQCQPDNGSSSPCRPNKSYLEWTYSPGLVEYYDETRRHWKRSYDVLGRLIAVLEPDKNNSPTIKTEYHYDTLGNLIDIYQIDDAGSIESALHRKFVYDSLSELTDTTNPENGAIHYEYDLNGNVSVKTDARSISTHYAYDELNRLKTKSYENDPFHTPAESFLYDRYVTLNICSGCVDASLFNQTYAIGKMTEAYTGDDVTRTVYAYDELGALRIKASCLSLSGGCKSGANFGSPIQYTNNLTGKVSSLTNGVSSTGIQFTYGYDASNQLSSVKSTWDDPTHPALLFANPSYNASGILTDVTYGTGITLHRDYSSRQWVSGAQVHGAINRPAVGGAATVSIVGIEQSR